MSVIIALLFKSTGSTSDLATSGHVCIESFVEILSNVHLDVVVAAWSVVTDIVSHGIGQQADDSPIHGIVMFVMDLAFSISSVLRFVRLSVIVILEPLS